MAKPVSTDEFLERLQGFMAEEYHLEPYVLTEADICAVKKLQAEVYDRWEWNYGFSPSYQIEKRRRVEGCGEIQIFMDVENGVIQKLAFYGDYFSEKDSGTLVERLVGTRLEDTAVRAAISDLDVGEYFRGLTNEAFCSVLL